MGNWNVSNLHFNFISTRLWLAFVCVLGLSTNIRICLADTPANCSYPDIEGKWLFKTGNGGHHSDLNCDQFTASGHTIITLIYPDIAVDEFGNQGFWTLIYNQGFEIEVHGRKYFAFSRFQNKKSFCSETMPGWSHNVVGKDWACFSGKKINANLKYSHDNDANFGHMFLEKYHHLVDQVDEQRVLSINNIQNLWKATVYPEHSHLSIAERVNMAGGVSSRIGNKPHPAPLNEDVIKLTSFLPSEFDWRNVDGMNYVSPVRNQGLCGSCYAFSSVGMTESRLRIISNNTLQPILSPQDVVECSRYSQGCDGGFPYLIAGKYAEDFGLVEETCNPYSGKESDVCSTKSNCSRWYNTQYKYVGGYYGGCNEELMKLALYKNGPLSVSFEVEKDFFQYKGGIYKHTGVDTSENMLHFNPFELTNHAVLLIGWGESDGTPYWIVKNSWGDTWGENGYFRIVRGMDECSIESLAVETFPVF